MVNDPTKLFNSGKQVEVSDDIGYTKTTLGINSVAMVQGDNEHASPLLHDPQSYFLEFGLKVLDGKFKGKTFEVYQKLFVGMDGEFRHPVSKGGYAKKDGTIGTNSLAYDILDAARALDPKQDRFGMVGLSKEQFIGLKFVMGLKLITTKDGETSFMLETDYQKSKDAAYAANRSTTQAGGFGSPANAEDEGDDQVVDPDDLPF